MASMKPINLRLTSSQLRILAKLSAKTGLDRSNVIRLAISRMAEAEGISPAASQR